ncbi:MAG: hypothetical protein ABSC25_18680 [Roseiarcus sp.]|jgi:hypothetical protein
MARLVSRVAIAAATSWLIAGCAYNDHFDNRVARYDIASEQARDQMIFTNIVRASLAEPLAFLQLGQINGSNTTMATMGVPSLVLGPAAPAKIPVGSGGTAFLASALDKQAVFGANPGAAGFTANSLSTSGTTNFNVTPAETKDFYRGLLLTVEPETLAFFLEQGIAPELLFYLFTDKVVEDKAGVINQYSNDPFDPSFGKFQYYVALAMTYGLTAEPEPGSKPPKPANSNKSDKSKGNDSSNGDNQPAQVWRLCFDKSAWAPGAKFADQHPMCGSQEKSKDPREVNFLDATGKRVEARVVSRSTFSIFQYLGRLVAEGEAAQIKLQTPQAVGTPPLQDDTLFAVSSGGDGLLGLTGGDVGLKGAGCFLTVDYGGKGYCVPDSALNTKRILGLLAQLLALSTTVQDVGITQQVQLLPQ